VNGLLITIAVVQIVNFLVLSAINANLQTLIRMAGGGRR